MTTVFNSSARVVIAARTGFIDYNSALPAISATANTWTNLNNDGQGAFTNKNYAPAGVTDMMDESNGALDFTQLSLGESVMVRNDFEITTSVNSTFVSFRYVLGSGLGEYTLEKQLGTLPNGSGETYKIKFTDLIYMGDDNTRLNPVEMQVRCSENATILNLGSVIQLIGGQI